MYLVLLWWASDTHGLPAGAKSYSLSVCLSVRLAVRLVVRLAGIAVRPGMGVDVHSPMCCHHGVYGGRAIHMVHMATCWGRELRSVCPSGCLAVSSSVCLAVLDCCAVCLSVAVQRERLYTHHITPRKQQQQVMPVSLLWLVWL